MNPSLNSSPTGNQNSFFGIKVSKAGIDVNNTNSPEQLVYDSNYSTQTWYDDSGNIVLQQGLLPSGNYGVASNNGDLTISNNGIVQIIIGLLPDGTYGMVVSQPGVSVYSAFS
jgi:hypothetical protein